MMPTGGNSFEFPRKDEAPQYIAYNVKELLSLLNEKMDTLDAKMDNLIVEYARLPSIYVTQEQYRQQQQDQITTRRAAVSAVIASVGALGTFIGIMVNALM